MDPYLSTRTAKPRDCGDYATTSGQQIEHCHTPFSWVICLSIFDSSSLWINRQAVPIMHFPFAGAHLLSTIGVTPITWKDPFPHTGENRKTGFFICFHRILPSPYLFLRGIPPSIPSRGSTFRLLSLLVKLLSQRPHCVFGDHRETRYTQGLFWLGKTQASKN